MMNKGKVEEFFNAARALSSQCVSNPLKAIWNKWPGDESIEEILNALNGKWKRSDETIVNKELTAEGLRISINPDGLPDFEVVAPMRFVTPEKRLQKTHDILDSIALWGYLCYEQKDVRNAVFDNRNEKSSIIFKYRTCKDSEEAELVLERAKQAINHKGDKQ